jgi:hypothetical protein
MGIVFDTFLGSPSTLTVEGLVKVLEIMDSIIYYSKGRLGPKEGGRFARR